MPGVTGAGSVRGVQQSDMAIYIKLGIDCGRSPQVADSIKVG